MNQKGKNPTEATHIVYEVLINRRKELFQYFYTLTGEKKAAEDILDDCFVRLLQRDVSSISNPLAYLKIMGKNLWLDRLRKRSLQTISLEEKRGADRQPNKYPSPNKVKEKLDREISQLFTPNLERKRKKRRLTYDEFLSDKMLMMELIQTGVPYSLFALISDVTPFSESDWADILDISTKSLHRYKQASKPFKPLQSEKIIEMGEVTNVGMEVFGNMEKFKLWLDTPNFSLGNLKPLELLKNSYGKELVVSELTRINYGILV